MCGISGIIKSAGCKLHLPSVVAGMANTLRHRGPDDEGFVFFGENGFTTAGGPETQTTAWNSDFIYAPQRRTDEIGEGNSLALAHRRLAVIDLTEAAHQPMCNDDGSVWIICNGEIYNYVELRGELESKGYVFKTRSDIEVLLKAYECWDVRCLDHLNGMWSFVIYDRKEQLLFGARDRFGVKPLYYYNSPEFFAFASEQKALLSIPGLDSGVNDDAVYEHLLLGQVELREEGFFRNIKELGPSHYFLVDAETRSMSIRRYYNLGFRHAAGRYSEKECEQFSEGIKDRIFRAVDIRLRSDVPVGFCLSGGLDSSSIVCVSEQIRQREPLKQLSEKLHTFTAVNSSRQYDESGWAAKAAGITNAEWIKAECNAEDILPSLEALIWHQDVPLYSTSTFAQSRVMKAAKEHGITILLDGQGGDELFAGYQTFYTSMLLGQMKRFNAKGFLRELFALKNSPSSAGIVARSLFKLMLQNALPGGIRNSIAASYRPELNYFSKQARREYSGLLNLAGEFSAMNVNSLLHHYFTGYYLKNLLRWEDRCSMQYSIESRTPFADDIELIEYVFSIPDAFKIRSGWSKLLLRKAMKGVLPEDIRLRTDKLGFATPQSDWLQQINPQMKMRIAELCPLDENKIIDHQRLLQNWDLIFSKPGLFKVQDMAWRYLNFLTWKKIFFSGQ